MNIRRLKDNETEFLSDMLYEAIYTPEGYEPPARDIIQDESLAKYIDHWGKDKYDIAIVTEVKNQLVGVIWGRLFKRKNKGFGF